MTAADVTALLAPNQGAEPEAEIVRDLVRRALPAAPVVIGVAALVDGVNGALSAAVGLALVVVNFAIAAASITWAARISYALLMGVSLFGYLLRLGALTGAVFLLRDLSWVHLPSLGITIVVAHLGLLLWETRYVSATLAHPALKPVPKERTR